MNKKTLIVIGSTVSILIILIVLFLYFSIKNSKGCDQLVIDTNEYASGIDIPKQKNSLCYYDEDEQIRIGIYTVVNSSNFINKNGLKKVDSYETILLWSTDFLVEKGAEIPLTTENIFRLAGKNKNNKWQCLVDKNTGKMWFEIKWN